MSKFKEIFSSDTDIKTKAEIFAKNAEISNEIKVYAKKCVSFIDLTTLEGSDTFEKVRILCDKGMKPSVIPGLSCAAICIYPRFISFTKNKLKGSGLKTASVATSFPSGQVPLDLKLQEVKYCIEQGAEEIDMVILRGEFLSGNYELVKDEIRQIKGLCNSSKHPVHLKVILETGELKTNENIYNASVLAIEGGADFIKTSTGKINPAATIESAYVMLMAIKEHYENTGKRVGFKPAGGIRTTEEALQYVSLVKNVVGNDWLKPELFRIGASSLLDNLLKDIV